MTALKYLAAAAVLAAPLFALAAPAEAYTARQYQAQGNGRYISSKGHSYGWHRARMHRRSWHRGY